MPTFFPGYLPPGPTPAPLEGTALEDFLQEIVVGVTAIDSDLVVPRWQPEPPDTPDVSVSWVALGITSRTPDTFAANIFQAGAEVEDDAMSLQRGERLDMLLSFYGPDANANASLFSDGMQIPQNREVLFVNGMAHVDCGELINAPELVKMLWRNRVDMRWTVMRQVRRVYTVGRFASASGVIHNEHYNTPFSVSE